MVDKNSDSPLQKLAKLSKQERAVLELRCKGLDYKTIAPLVHIAETTVKQYMKRIYWKLGLNIIPPAQRMKTIYQVYCPLLDSPELPPARPENEPVEGISEPIPPEIDDMVDEDEYLIVHVPSQPMNTIPVPANPRKPRRAIIMLMLVLVLGICLGATGIVYAGRLFDLSAIPLPFIPQLTATITPTSTPLPTASAMPSPTAELPTQTPVVEVVVVTATPPPPTALPTSTDIASVALPFVDNFDNGVSPSWEILNGTWITVDGRYTPYVKNNSGDNWLWSIVRESSWKNYRVSVNLQVPYAYSANQGQFAIVIRVSNGQTRYLGFYVDYNMRGSWAFIGNGYSDEERIAGRGDSLTGSENIEIEVKGNSYTALVNGQIYQQITIPGYEQGGVGLGVLCEADKCPSFDNFKVEEITQ